MLMILRPAVLRFAPLALMVVLSACATARETPPAAVEPAGGVRLGVMVARMNGETVLSARANERFIPASNTKIFTAAAAFHYLPGLDQPDPDLGTALIVVPGEAGAAPALVLAGHGDPTVQDSDACASNCLRELADAAAARGITRVSGIYADESAFPGEPWGMGWSWNNLPFYFGAPISALSVNANTVSLRVGPGRVPGESVAASWAPGDALMDIRNEALTSAAGTDDRLSVMRRPGSSVVVLTGSLPAGEPARTYVLSVPDAAQSAVERLTRLLRARGVIVDDGALAWPDGKKPAGEEIARLSPPPLIDSVTLVSKDSDNLSAELLLRHIGAAGGGGGAEAGLDAVHAMLDAAGIGRADVELFDGSGLSPYNRITPAATVKFLAWTQLQTWGVAFRETLPVGGRDGSLARRFRSTPLEGRIFAKTGTVQGVNALSGFLIADSGETLIFSVIANDRPVDGDPVISRIDTLLLKVAAEN